MSGFDLVRVDGGGGGGGDPIHLPPGETVLGRGPFLATHLNPCFVQSSRSDSPRPLQRDSWYPLHDGDLFSLLPGQFIFQVVAVGGEDPTPRNSQLLEEEEEEGLPVSAEPEMEPPPRVGPTPPRNEPAPAPAAQSDQEEADNGRLNEADCAQPTEEEDNRRPVPPPVTKRRVLPAWMMTAVAHTQSPSSSSSSPKVPPAAKRSKAPPASGKGAAAKQATPPKTSSLQGAGLSEEEEEEEERPKKRRRKRSDEEQTASQSKTDLPPQQPSVRLPSESKRSEMSDESDGFPMETDEAEGGGETSTADGNAAKNCRRQTKRAESVAANSGPRLRTACPYGKSCYRKNPVHFQECSHPGDTDYEEDDEEEEEEEEETGEADRPECPYGTDCYRKNPLHRKEYKHTKKPARAARGVPKKDGVDEDSGDDDSFIDDSEDAGDDSDYLPPVSDDSDKEDVKALQKEAKAFMKRK
ncbi:aprataxin and PNK-like factor isoform X2 [Perca flavescens]|uniref:aprataxin and PNK-like factor isoform X2 n=1 Tax=Perca flavescens TaxID=8167 RepID=UPI00106EE42F|nr:aprataxin and PNK-like factor isoform X2 [Perca flavescens]